MDYLEQIRVTSLNVRGLRKKTKRRSIFRFLREQKYDFICLQETYITEKDHNQWKKEWGGGMVSFEGTNHGRGQIILIRKGFPVDWTIELREDRILIIKINADKSIGIINVYAPCGQKQTKDFIEKTKEVVNELDADLKVICGDFNTVLSNENDIISGEKHPTSLVESFNNFIHETDLKDIWRIFNPELKEYTWSRKSKGKFTARRLDYILLNDNATEICGETNLFSIPSSDHRGVTITLKCTENKRGPGYYKFNNLLLKDTRFVSYMNNVIEEYIAEQKDENPEILWELLKHKIKNESIRYSKNIAINKRNRLIELYANLNGCDTALANNPDNQELQHEREQLKFKIDLFEQERTKSAILRCKEKIIVEGEKNSKYFLNLEKSRAAAKHFPNIELDNGDILTNQFDILNAQKEYYKTLYSNEMPDENLNYKIETFLKDCEVPKLSEEEMKSCEGIISIGEATCALKMLNNDSSPGLDGLTTEFLKVFWNKLKQIVVNSFNKSFNSGSLSHTQKLAVITLLHKGKDLPKNKLNNWRPISLTNADYKILAKCLANRLSNVIKTCISEDQVGYIKGRNVSSTLRTIDDIIDYWNLKNKPGILLALDFRKAFDSISKQYMKYAFRKFGFGTDFLKWVQVLFSDTKSCMIYNGWITEDFNVLCGIRQGCPFSPLAFIIGVELLAVRFRQTEGIRGLELNAEKIIKVLLYADDITVFLRDEGDFNIIMQIINEFSNISNLYLNKEKSEAMGIGQSKNMRRRDGLKWVKEIKILGIFFSNTMCASVNEKNWQERINTIKRMIVQWEKRQLGYLGKICVIKSLFLSQLIYVMQAICIPEHVLKEINTILYRFLWRKKDCNKRAFEKVKRVVVNADYDKGGLKMFDVIVLQESFMCEWLSKLSNQIHNHKWTWIPDLFLKYFGKQYACLLSTVGTVRFKGMEYVQSYFWKKAAKVWLYYNKVHDYNSMGDNCIWNNENITYHKRVLFYEKWTSKITFVKDMVRNNRILQYQEIEDILGYSPNLRLEYNVVHTALVNVIRKQNGNEEINYHHSNGLVLNNKKCTKAKDFRKHIVDSKYTTPCATRFWLNNFNFVVNDKIWNIANSATKESRLRELQWKILHNLYPTNILLLKIGEAENNRCSLCYTEIDYIEHFFFNCQKISKLWSHITNIISKNLSLTITLTVESVLLGFVKKENLKLTK